MRCFKQIKWGIYASFRRSWFFNIIVKLYRRSRDENVSFIFVERGGCLKDAQLLCFHCPTFKAAALTWHACQCKPQMMFWSDVLPKNPFSYYIIWGSRVCMFWSRVFRCQLENLKGIVHVKIRILSLFTHHVIPNLYDWLSSGGVWMLGTVRLRYDYFHLIFFPHNESE